MTNNVDVLVVGAGVAGATAAIGLARQGLQVMLVDRAKFPRHKVCGCCLNSDAIEVLEDLKLGDSLMQLGATPIERVSVHNRRYSVTVTSRGGVAVSRYALDAMLHDAAIQSGCRVHDQTSARIIQIPDDDSSCVSVKCWGSLAPSSPIQARIVLVADGLSGSCMVGIQQTQRVTQQASLRGYGAHLSMDRHDLPYGEVIMHCAPGGYAGTVVLEDGSLDIAAAMKPSYVKSFRGPSGAVQALMQRSGFILPGLSELQWKATAPLTGSREQVWMRRVFFLGDSAGYVEPFTGEGMAWAMRAAQALQPIVVRSMAGWHDQLGDDWRRVYRHVVQRRQWRCRIFSHALRHPRLVTSMIRSAGLLPPSARQRIVRSFLPPLFKAQSHTRKTELTAA